jgi:hypothetical protein
MDYKIRQGIILFLLFLWPKSSFSQNLQIGFGYSYVYAKQWDKAIQTYNFSRPFNVKKQPLLENGVTIYSSYLFNSSRGYRHGIYCSYSYFNSVSINENLSNTLNLHLVKPGYVIHLENNGQLKCLSVDLIVSALLGGLFRRVNHTPYFYDDKRAKAFGIGGTVDIRFAYRCLQINKQLTVSPYATAGFTPYFFEPGFESLINQTKQLASMTSTKILNLDLGIILTRKLRNTETIIR